MKYILILCLLFGITLVKAQNAAMSLAIPSSPGSYLSDRFRSGDLDCSMAIGSGTNIEFGVLGVINGGNQTISTSVAPQNKDVGVYGRIIIPIGTPKGRVDCSILYDLELKKKRMEIQKLESELNNLKNLKFENAK
jgi:hypothetical protein